MAGKTRLNEIDCMRGMAILMVLLYHSVIVFPVNLHEIRWCFYLHQFLWMVQMPLFFLVSGFCFSFWENQETYGKYFVKKCKRILIPHVVFSALDILPRVIDNPLVHEKMDLKTALLDFLFYGGSDWFLRVLFMIVLLFPGLTFVLKKNPKAVLVVSIMLWALQEYLPGIFLIDMTAGYLLFFTIGWICRLNREYLVKESLTVTTLISTTLGMLGFFWITLLTQNRVSELLCVLCSFPLFYGLAGRCTGRLQSFFTTCGEWSLQMYLFDAYAVVATRTVLTLMLGVTNPILIILGNFIPDVCIVLILAKYIVAKMPFVRTLCGIPKGN